MPADVRSILGISECKISLHTSEYLQAYVRAAPYIAVVARIQAIRQSYQALQIGENEYISALLRCSMSIDCMVRNRKKKLQDNRLGLIEFATFSGHTCRIDYDGDHEKEVEAAKLLMNSDILAPEENEATDVFVGMVFSELYAKFLNHKTDSKVALKEQRKPLTERMRAEYDRYTSALIEIMGDLPITDITRKKLKDAVLTYGCLPKRNLKKYKDVAVLELLEMDIPSVDRISNKTTKQVAKMVQGIFSYAVEKDLLESSPARDMKLKLESRSTYAALSDEEVMSIITAASKESIQWKKWTVNLAAYTGARRGELAQLRKQDVKIDTDSGRYYILITDKAGHVKSENATRQVPLHNKLVEMGFMEFVASANDRLFEGLNPQAVTKWFTRLRDSLSIDLLDDYDNRKVFHSFRHTFITRSRGAGNPLEHVQQVVGHEKIDAGITDAYTHTQPLKVVLGVVDKVEYG